jgi:hypothetical protein
VPLVHRSGVIAEIKHFLSIIKDRIKKEIHIAANIREIKEETLRSNTGKQLMRIGNDVFMLM